MVNSYALVPLKAGEVVTQAQVRAVPDRRLTVNSLVVNIPTKRLEFASELQPGEIVSLTAIPADPADFSPTVVLAETLLFDVGRSGNDPTVTLAVPLAEWPNFLAKTKDARLIIAKLAK